MPGNSRGGGVIPAGRRWGSCQGPWRRYVKLCRVTDAYRRALNRAPSDGDAAPPSKNILSDGSPASAGRRARLLFHHGGNLNIMATTSAQPKQRTNNCVAPRSVSQSHIPPPGRRDGQPEGKRVKNLTERQLEVLDFIRGYVEEHGFPPARPEIAKALGVAHVSTVDWHLLALMKKGWIEMRHDTPRGLRLLREDLPIVSVGAIAAGEPIFDEAPSVPRMPKAVARQFSPRPDYFLTVEGDSMNRLGLTDGSVIAVATDRVPKDGDVVVARLGEQVTLKRYKRVDDRHVELRPESTNEEHRLQVVDAEAEQLHIEGVMVGALIGPATELAFFD
ncbi:MAG: repressor LexA [Chloroflexi bacterium]|nr:repressor LexA [Chloroflexota bacterium]